MWVDYYMKGPERKALSFLNGYYINCTLYRIPPAAVVAYCCKKRNRNQHCTTQTQGEICTNWLLLFWPDFLSRCSKRFGNVSDKKLAVLWKSGAQVKISGCLILLFPCVLHMTYFEPSLGILGGHFTYQ